MVKQYDFDEIIDREKTDSIKWSKRVMKKLFGYEDLLPLWVADMDFKAPKEVLDSLQDRLNHGIFGYSTIGKKYLSSIINWFKKNHQWEIHSQWIRYSPGIVPAINFLILQFTKPGDSIIIQPPVYYPFKASIKNNGRKILKNKLILKNGMYTIDFDNLEKLCSQKRVKMLIFCSPHNPVGRVWTRKEQQKLGNICLKNNILVISDEIHCDLILSGNQHVPFASISEKFALNSITCTAPTKTFNLAGLHVSNLIIPNEKLRNEYSTIQERLAIQVPTVFAAQALIAAYSKGRKWLNACISYIEENLHFFESELKKKLPKVQITPLEGTYLLWVDFRGYNLSKEKINQIIREEAKIALDSGEMFGEGGSGFQRFNIACPRQILRDTLNRLGKAFNSHN